MDHGPLHPSPGVDAAPPRRFAVRRLAVFADLGTGRPPVPALPATAPPPAPK